MRSGIGSGASAAGSGGGRVTCTRGPASSFTPAFAARAPSTVTKPSSIRRRTRERVSCGRRRATKTSSRSPARSATRSWTSATGRWLAEEAFAFQHQEEPEDGDHADADGGVGDVEGWPEVEVDEVGHLAGADAVEQVAGCPAELEPERRAQQAVLERRVQIVEDDSGHAD